MSIDTTQAAKAIHSRPSLFTPFHTGTDELVLKKIQHLMDHNLIQSVEYFRKCDEHLHSMVSIKNACEARLYRSHEVLTQALESATESQLEKSWEKFQSLAQITAEISDIIFDLISESIQISSSIQILLYEDRRYLINLVYTARLNELQLFKNHIGTRSSQAKQHEDLMSEIRERKSAYKQQRKDQNLQRENFEQHETQKIAERNLQVYELHQQKQQMEQKRFAKFHQLNMESRQMQFQMGEFIDDELDKRHRIKSKQTRQLQKYKLIEASSASS